MSGIDAKTRSRIERLVADADYPDAVAAVDDAWRTALLASDPGAARSREAARVAAVQEANEKRMPGAPRVRQATTAHRIVFVGALVLGAMAVGLIAVSPRTGGTALELQDGAVIAGLLALGSAGLLVWLDPLRRNGSLWGPHIPAALYAFYGFLWIGFALFVVIFRWDDVDRFDPAPVIIGLVLFVAAGVIALILWRRAVRADRTASHAGVALTLGGLIDDADRTAVWDALDVWWGQHGPAALERDGEQLTRSHRAVLEHLRSSLLIQPEQERAAASSRPPTTWGERRR